MNSEIGNFVTNNSLKLSKKKLESCMMHFQSLQIKKSLNVESKNFRLFLVSKGMQNRG